MCGEENNDLEPNHSSDLAEGENIAQVSETAAGKLSRRSLLRGAAVAAALGGASLEGMALAKNTPLRGSSPWAGRRFRGFVIADGKAQLADLELIWPLNPRQVIIATEATQASYSEGPSVLKAAERAVERPSPPVIAGYVGAGTVVYVGEHVRRVQVGDRVVVGVTPQCGSCYNCLRGRADTCQFLGGVTEINGNPNPPFARLVSDGREVVGGRNGYSELMVAYEEWVVPLFTDLPASALSLLGSVGATGLAAATMLVPVEPGSDVVVFGCGPIGLSMVNGAAALSANRIIAVEPIAYRREAALALGATDVVDPTGKDETLVAELIAMTNSRTRRNWAGGRGAMTRVFPFNANGPDFIFEATGSQLFDPSERGIEPQPDPSGAREVQQIMQLCPSYGTVVTTGVRWNFGTNIPIPGTSLTNAGKRLVQGQFGGAHLMRDLPRMVNMMERGQYKWDKIVSAEYPLEQARQSFEDAAYRTKISSHVVFDPAPFIE